MEKMQYFGTATIAFTGIGNVLPDEVLHLTNLALAAAKGEAEARQRALELEQAMSILASFDEEPDLILYFKHMLVLRGEPEYTLHFNDTDELTPSQRGYVEAQLELFDAWLRTRETTGCDRRRVLAVPTYLRGYLDESRETLAGVPRLPAG